MRNVHHSGFLRSQHLLRGSTVFSSRAVQLTATVGLLLLPAIATPAHADPLRTLLVGGGPNVNKNQVAIESNVRYLLRLLPKDAITTTLFADGDVNNSTVLYSPQSGPVQSTTPNADAIFSALFPRPQRGRGFGGADGGSRRGNVQGNSSGRENQTPSNANSEVPSVTNTAVTSPAPTSVSPVAGSADTQAQGENHQGVGAAQGGAQGTPVGTLKKPDLTKIDGPSNKESIEKAIADLGKLPHSSSPYFLYFTGHGHDTPGDQENNFYRLWNDGQYTVQELSKALTTLPEKEPVVLVMVQCYSGSFGNLLFDGADPKGKLADRDLVGFFASTKDRTAAGCTPSINEEYYYDFTSYFFQALTGRDRLNRPFQGNADYNKDGKIGLDEAFYWSLINDNSIDVPVATSDVFLERLVALDGDSWQDTTYSTLIQWASPAQRVVLNELSFSLELTGEKRIRDAQNLDINKLGGEKKAKLDEIDQRIGAIRETTLPVLQAQFPNLTQLDSPQHPEVRRQALAQLEKEVATGKWKELLALSQERAQAKKQITEPRVYTAKRLRFLRVAQKVVQDHALRNSNNEPIKQRYLRLLEHEAKSLLPPRKNLLAKVPDAS